MPWADDGGPVPNAARCSPIVDNPGESGATCQIAGALFSGLDDCDAGLFCNEVDNTTGEGTCRALCSQAPSCDDPETRCVGWFEGALPVCSLACSALPSATTPCPSGNACYATAPVSNCDEAVCGFEISSGGQGDPCLLLNDCRDGFQCVDGARVPQCDSEMCCTELCNLDEPSQCVEGTSCGLEPGGGCGLPVTVYLGVCLTFE